MSVVLAQDKSTSRPRYCPIYAQATIVRWSGYENPNQMWVVIFVKNPGEHIIRTLPNPDNDLFVTATATGHELIVVQHSNHNAPDPTVIGEQSIMRCKQKDIFKVYELYKTNITLEMLRGFMRRKGIKDDVIDHLLSEYMKKYK